MMTKAIVAGLFCCAVLNLPVLAQGGEAAAMSDQDFVNLAAQTDMTEAHLGQMAADQAESQAVKDYAQMLVTDHTNDYTQLSTAAGKAGLTVPKGIDEKHNKMIAMFEKLKGGAFDHHYIHEMAVGHEAAIAAYKKEVQEGQNPDIKAYATQALPILEKHLNGAKDLEKGKAAPKTSS
jgi:putative membrane protein